MRETMTIFAIFGFFMLIGVAGKNGILLVDFAKQLMEKGKSRADAVVEAGKTRLRPILMTSFALVAGLCPWLSVWNEASKSRTAMGVGDHRRDLGINSINIDCRPCSVCLRGSLQSTGE